jgi:hypothetical protein
MSLALCQVALELFEVEAGDPRRNLTPQSIIASEVNAKGCQERAAEEGLQARPGNTPHRSSMPDVLAKSRASSAANQENADRHQPIPRLAQRRRRPQNKYDKHLENPSNVVTSESTGSRAWCR